MEYDARDRREQDPDDTGDQGTEDQLTQPSEPDAAAEPAVPSSDIESWPSQDVARTWPTEPPAAGSAEVEAWPTEPPLAAAPDAAEAWPTEPPEQGDEPVVPPASEPPPADVEAYPARAPSPQPDPEPGPEPEPQPELPPTPVPVPGGATAESTRCPRCGTENQAGLSFCRNCGQRLIAAGVASTVERPAAPEGSMACPRCGTHNRAGVAFCQNCGANLRGTSEGYVPPAVAGEAAHAPTAEARDGAVLGPVVLLIGIVGLVTAYLLPFAFDAGSSLYDRALGASGYGAAFWSAYPDGGLAESAYFGLAAASPVLVVLLVVLAVAGFLRSRPGLAQSAGLIVALLWSVAIVVLFVAVELIDGWDGDIVGLLSGLSAGGIIFMLASLIVLIGTLTRFGRS